MNFSHTRKVSAIGLLATIILSPAASVLAADESSDLGSAIASGDAGFDLRYRHELVDQDGISKDASASTVRARLNFKTGSWRNWSGFVEFDHVFHIIDNFNSGAGTSSDRGQYPVVADPEGSDLNQLYVDYSSSDDWKVRVGRQRILLDNQRFVGGVGWRQNEQTYDGLTFTTSAIANTSLQYSYVANVRRIFGERVDAGSDKSNHHLVNAKIKLNDSWSVVPYVYLLDYDFTAPVPDLPLSEWDANERRRALSSTATAGIRIAGNLAAGDGKIALLGEFATQSDGGDNPVNYDAQYKHLSAMWALADGLSLGVAFESLGTDSTSLRPLATPLATAHAFQGWADKFLSTPSGGIDDLYLTVKYKAGKWSLTGVYHDFSAETGSADYGTEIDFAAGRGLGDRYKLLLKLAVFDADNPSYVDTTKAWLMLSAGF